MQYSTIEDTFQYLDKIPAGNLIEFGVFNGNTMGRLIKGSEEAGNPFKEIHGFDSFVGLPRETSGVETNTDWPEGAFSLSDTFKIESIDEAVEFVRSNIIRKDVHLYPGFFTESLTPELGAKLAGTASYIHVDVDIYSSSWQVLDWIFQHKIIKRGGIIRMDDFISTTLYRGGNSLAWIDVQRKYRFISNPLSINVFQYLE